MPIRSLFLPLALAAACLFTALPAAAHHQHTITGDARGAWDLPGPNHAGAMRGVLLGPMGHPLFVVDAHLLPGPMGMGGHIVGELSRPGPNGRRVARVFGHYLASSSGQGRFEAVFVRPGDPHAGTPSQRIGGMRGGFMDPHGPGTPGMFRGRYRITH